MKLRRPAIAVAFGPAFSAAPGTLAQNPSQDPKQDPNQAAPQTRLANQPQMMLQSTDQDKGEPKGSGRAECPKQIEQRGPRRNDGRHQAEVRGDPCGRGRKLKHRMWSWRGELGQRRRVGGAGTCVRAVDRIADQVGRAIRDHGGCGYRICQILVRNSDAQAPFHDQSDHSDVVNAMALSGW